MSTIEMKPLHSSGLQFGHCSWHEGKYKYSAAGVPANNFLFAGMGLRQITS